MWSFLLDNILPSATKELCHVLLSRYYTSPVKKNYFQYWQKAWKKQRAISQYVCLQSVSFYNIITGKKSSSIDSSNLFSMSKKHQQTDWWLQHIDDHKSWTSRGITCLLGRSSQPTLCLFSFCFYPHFYFSSSPGTYEENKICIVWN